MLAAVYESFGKPADVLQIVDRPLPSPGSGQIRVRMTLASIHNHDLLTVAGQYGYKPPLPAMAGSEAMGTVDALGEGVANLKVGQRVAASGLTGAWAGYFLAEAATAVPLPDVINDETAAQLISMPLSALVLLEYLGVEKGQWVVQNAATGAVAKVLAMIAAERGINVVNLVRREEAIVELEALGIPNAISTADPDWRTRAKSLAGAASFAAAVDGVGGPQAADLTGLLGENGVLVSFGAMSGQPLQLPASDLIFKQAVVKGFWLAKIMRTTPRETIGRWMTELVTLVAMGKVRLQTGGIFDLADIASAATAAEQAGRPGKILIRG